MATSDPYLEWDMTPERPGPVERTVDVAGLIHDLRMFHRGCDGEGLRHGRECWEHDYGCELRAIVEGLEALK